MTPMTRWWATAQAPNRETSDESADRARSGTTQKKWKCISTAPPRGGRPSPLMVSRSKSPSGPHRPPSSVAFDEERGPRQRPAPPAGRDRACRPPRRRSPRSSGTPSQAIATITPINECDAPPPRPAASGPGGCSRPRRERPRPAVGERRPAAHLTVSGPPREVWRWCQGRDSRGRAGRFGQAPPFIGTTRSNQLRVRQSMTRKA